MSFDLSNGESPGTSDSQINGSKVMVPFSCCENTLDINRLIEIIDSRTLRFFSLYFILNTIKSKGKFNFVLGKAFNLQHGTWIFQCAGYYQLGKFSGLYRKKRDS